MNKYDLILFDMDGTTVDTDELIIQTMNQLYDLYRDGNRSPYEKVIYFSGPPIRISLQKEFPNMDVDFLVNEFKRISYALYPVVAKPYPHCRETMINLKNQGIKLGIVTNKSNIPAFSCMKIVRIDDLIDFCIGAQDVSAPKPSPEGILLAMDKFNIKDKKRVLYVGDNEIDLNAANNAGVDSAIATWGPRVFPKHLNPTYRFNSYEEFEALLNE